MHHAAPFTALTAAASLAACAHGPPPAAGPPDYCPVATETAPFNARYYAECIGQAAAGGPIAGRPTAAAATN